MRPLALAALLTAACAPVPAPPAPAPSLIGEWRVTAVNGRPVTGVARIVPPILVTNFGCNSGQSGFRIEGSVLVPVGPMATTERGCMNALDDGPSEAAQHEDEGFRIVHRPMQVAFYGPNRARLSNEAGTIELTR